ncbi:MAG: hypothetical protein VYD57_09490 [Pseudomonadota bacterium]|nr:hypothetical protein [Pseudomonadota bacterium]
MGRIVTRQQVDGVGKCPTGSIQAGRKAFCWVALKLHLRPKRPRHHCRAKVDCVLGDLSFLSAIHDSNGDAFRKAIRFVQQHIGSRLIGLVVIVVLKRQSVH